MVYEIDERVILSNEELKTNVLCENGEFIEIVKPIDHE